MAQNPSQYAGTALLVTVPSPVAQRHAWGDVGLLVGEGVGGRRGGRRSERWRSGRVGDVPWRHRFRIGGRRACPEVGFVTPTCSVAGQAALNDRARSAWGPCTGPQARPRTPGKRVAAAPQLPEVARRARPQARSAGCSRRASRCSGAGVDVDRLGSRLLSSDRRDAPRAPPFIRRRRWRA
jgi:hypothetical protein